MTSSLKQHRVASVDEASARFKTLHIDDDIMSSIVVVVAAAARKKLFSFLDSSSSLTSIYEDPSETHENANRRKSTRQSLMKVKSDKILSMRQDILIDRVNHLHIENTGFHYRLESLEKSVKFELASKQNVIQLQHFVQGDISVLTQSMNNKFAKLLT